MKLQDNYLSDIEAVLFDWDGVVIDSKSQHERSWNRMAATYDLPLPEGHFLKGFGKRNEEIIPDILGWSTTAEETQKWADLKEEMYRELIREDGIEPLDGVREFVARLIKCGIRRSIASSTPRANIQCSLEITGLAPHFEAMTGAEDVSNGKPAPDVFFQAAEKVGADPTKCIVLEDSFSGIEAGKNAGAFVIGIATTNPIESLTMADWAVHSLHEIEVTAHGFFKRS